VHNVKISFCRAYTLWRYLTDKYRSTFYLYQMGLENPSDPSGHRCSTLLSKDRRYIGHRVRFLFALRNPRRFAKQKDIQCLFRGDSRIINILPSSAAPIGNIGRSPRS